MNAHPDWARALADLEKRVPGFRVLRKHESRLMRVIAMLLKPISPEFMELYTTVIGSSIYMPERLIGTRSGAGTLRHEAVHIEDARRWGLLFYLTYLLLPLPILLSGRAVWEARACGRADVPRYLEERGGDRCGVLKDVEARASIIASRAYLWPCPKWLVRRLILREAEKAGVDLTTP